MKRISYLAGLVLLLAASAARAWSYKDGDVLLIFRESGLDDVEFDIGNVNQFLNHTNGYTTAVTGWDVNLVTGTFGTDLTGVSVIVLATTSLTNGGATSWLSGSEPNAAAYSVTPSTWQGALWSTINSIGNRPLIYQVPTAEANAYALDPGGAFQVATYDQIAGGGISLSTPYWANNVYLPTLGGKSPFVVEQVIPGSFDFWSIAASKANPALPDTYVGSFSITADGQLVFVAGPPSPTIEGVARSSGVSTVSFSTIVSGQYWLAFTNTLGAPVSTWPIVSGPLPGDGRNDSLTHTNSDGNGFYSVIRSP